MNSCKYCKVNLEEDETVYTDYFQVHGEGAEVYTLCGKCYLKEVEKYLKEEKPRCICGAPEVRYFDDDDETISMGIHEAIIDLTCSEIQKRFKAGEFTVEYLGELEEYEEIGDNHTIHSMHYIRWFTDEEMGWD